jgi:rubredoxin
MLWKCSVCGYLHEGNEAYEKCPKCGASKEQSVALTEEESKKIFESDRTNDIHMEIIKLSMKIKDLAKEGIKINLDDSCVSLFKQAHDESWIIKERSKAELASHASKGKW